MEKLFDPVKKVIEEAMVSYIYPWTPLCNLFTLCRILFVFMQMLPFNLMDMSFDMQSQCEIE